MPKRKKKKYPHIKIYHQNGTKAKNVREISQTDIHIRRVDDDDGEKKEEKK